MSRYLSDRTKKILTEILKMAGRPPHEITRQINEIAEDHDNAVEIYKYIRDIIDIKENERIIFILGLALIRALRQVEDEDKRRENSAYILSRIYDTVFCDLQNVIEDFDREV